MRELLTVQDLFVATDNSKQFIKDLEALCIKHAGHGADGDWGFHYEGQDLPPRKKEEQSHA